MLATSMSPFFENDRDTLVMASGVSNSMETDESEFRREVDMVRKFSSFSGVFVYFSSCALVDPSSQDNRYYRHKLEIESLIKESSPSYLIVRVPQVIGRTPNLNTLVNSFANSIATQQEIVLWKGATRYLVDVDDVAYFTRQVIDSNNFVNSTLNFGHPRLYSVEEILNEMFEYFGKTTLTKISDRVDTYRLNLDIEMSFNESLEEPVLFDAGYLSRKLAKYFPK